MVLHLSIKERQAGHVVFSTFQDRFAIVVISTLTVRVPHSIPHQRRTYIDSQSMLTKWGQAAHLSLYRSEPACNQARCQEAKAEQRWEFALSGKSLWHYAIVSLNIHQCKCNTEVIWERSVSTRKLRITCCLQAKQDGDYLMVWKYGNVNLNRHFNETISIYTMCAKRFTFGLIWSPAPSHDVSILHGFVSICKQDLYF